MSDVDSIFSAVDAADVRLWRDGDGLRFKAPHKLPDALARELHAHKAALLACLPDGYGWHHGAVCVKTIDWRRFCFALAKRYGFPTVHVETLDDCVVVVRGVAAQWHIFAERAVIETVQLGCFALDDYAATRKRGAA